LFASHNPRDCVEIVGGHENPMHSWAILVMVRSLAGTWRWWVLASSRGELVLRPILVRDQAGVQSPRTSDQLGLFLYSMDGVELSLLQSQGVATSTRIDTPSTFCVQRSVIHSASKSTVVRRALMPVAPAGTNRMNAVDTSRRWKGTIRVQCYCLEFSPEICVGNAINGWQ
jgi:hypothetical protein